MLFLDDFLEMLEELPSELRDRCKEIKDLDAEVVAKRASTEAEIAEYFNTCDSMNLDVKTARLKEIQAKLAYLRSRSEEKIALSERMQELLEKYNQHLEKEKMHLKYELEADNAGVTEVIEKRFADYVDQMFSMRKEKRRRPHPNTSNGINGGTTNGVNGNNQGIADDQPGPSTSRSASISLPSHPSSSKLSRLDSTSSDAASSPLPPAPRSRKQSIPLTPEETAVKEARREAIRQQLQASLHLKTQMNEEKKERGGSRSGFAPPPSSKGFSPSVKVDRLEGTGMGGRPPTGMVHPNIVNRPLTQQGLRAPTRAGTASGKRQVLDKSYFVGLLRTKANELSVEINRLSKDLEKSEKMRMETVVYDKKAEEFAIYINKMQGRLLDYNSLLDKMHSTSELSVLEMEANDLKIKADEVAASLEELFKEKKQKDDEVNRLDEEIALQKRRNQSAIASMDPSIKDNYESLKAKSDQLKELINDRENELSELVNLKNQLETDLLNSPLKQKAANLREELDRLNREEKELMEEEQNKESLDEKKAKLIQSARKNNEEIAAMEKQYEQIKEQIEISQEELQEFNANLESDNRDQLERYQGLQTKETEMNEFLSSYEDQKRNLQLEYEEFQDGIVKNLRRFAANLGKVNMTMQVNDLDPSILEMSDGLTVTELKDLHVRLEDEYLSLDELETRIRAELDAFEARKEAMQEELDEMPDYNRMVMASEEESMRLERQRDELNREVPAMEEELNEIEGDYDEISSELRGDDTVEIAANLTKKLDYIDETNRHMREQIEEIEAEGNYEVIKNEVLTLQKEYNKLLLAVSKR